jgi:hypothetical protein
MVKIPLMRTGPQPPGAVSKACLMNYPTPDYRSRYARALKAATNLASAAMYRTDRTPAFMPRQLRESMNVPDENLCLLPLAGSYPYGLDRAVHETRTTVLVDSDAERHRRSLLYLPAWRRVAVARLRAMRTAVETPRELAVSCAVVVAGLSNLRNSIALRVNILDGRLASSWQEGRRITIPRRRRSEGVERLRGLVRTRQPDPTLEMFPPPGARPPAPANALLLAAERMELLRVHVRRREKRVREALRKRALDRLARLDIPVAVNADGEYEVAKGALLDEEIRVLMDPSLHAETQRFLTRIARQQHDRAVEQAMQSSAAQPSTVSPDLTLGILAAAAKKLKGNGKG